MNNKKTKKLGISNSKKAMGDLVLWIGRIILTVLFVSILMFILKNTIDDSLDLQDMYFYPVAERFLYSNDCFVALNDERPMPGIISIERFTEDNINSCMEIINKPVGARLTLFDGTNEKKIYYNEERFHDIEPLTFSKQFHLVKRRYYVLIEEEGKNEPGNLLVEVAWQE